MACSNAASDSPYLAAFTSREASRVYIFAITSSFACIDPASLIEASHMAICRRIAGLLLLGISVGDCWPKAHGASNKASTGQIKRRRFITTSGKGLLDGSCSHWYARQRAIHLSLCRATVRRSHTVSRSTRKSIKFIASRRGQACTGALAVVQ